MKQDLITLSEQFPGIMVQVSLEDLLTAGRTLSEEIIERIDQKADYAFQNKPQQEEFITREETFTAVETNGVPKFIPLMYLCDDIIWAD